MKLLITESQEKYLLENFDRDDFYEILNNVTYHVFSSIRNKEKIKFELINPIQYKRALDEFIRYGEFMRFPSRIIYKWKEMVLYNIALLDALTSIHGHSEYFPFDEFYDEFGIPEEEQNNDFGAAYDILDDEYHIDDYVPFFSNGQCVLSDYGIKPLFNLADKLVDEHTPEKIIVIINQILDVAHQRSDLSELFVVGGADAQYQISNG